MKRCSQNFFAQATLAAIAFVTPIPAWCQEIGADKPRRFVPRPIPGMSPLPTVEPRGLPAKPKALPARSKRVEEPATRANGAARVLAIHRNPGKHLQQLSHASEPRPEHAPELPEAAATDGDTATSRAPVQSMTEGSRPARILVIRRSRRLKLPPTGTESAMSAGELARTLRSALTPAPLKEGKIRIVSQRTDQSEP